MYSRLASFDGRLSLLTTPIWGISGSEVRIIQVSAVGPGHVYELSENPYFSLDVIFLALAIAEH
jgi:hypothetical protein